MRWGERVALRPSHIEFLRRCVTVEETIVEVSKKHSSTAFDAVKDLSVKERIPDILGGRLFDF
jgi:hypothetical protein